MARNGTLTGVNLDGLKFEVAEDLAHFPDQIRDEAQFRRILDDFKFEAAQELGIPLNRGYNGDLRARDAGRLGGKIGGKIGGQMVRRMIQLAEQQLDGGAPRQG